MTDLLSRIQQLRAEEQQLRETKSALYNVQTAIQERVSQLVADQILAANLLAQYRWTDIDIGIYFISLTGLPKVDGVDPLRAYLDDRDDLPYFIVLSSANKATLRVDACRYELHIDIDNETDIDTVVTWLGQLHLTLDTTSLHDELTKTATTITALERELAVVRTLSTGDDCHGPIGNC